LNRTANAWRNVFWGMANRTLKLVVPFFLRTLIIYKIGIEYLGLDGLFVSVIQVLNIAELGVSSAITFSMYKPLAEKDTATVCALLSFYRKIYHIIGIVILFLGLSMLPFLDMLISGAIPKDINIHILYILYLLNIVLGYFIYAYKNSLLIAAQRSDIISNIDSVLLFIKCIVQGIVIFQFNNYYLYVLVQPVFTVLNNISIYYISSKYYPMYVCEGEIDNSLYQDIKKRVAGLMIYRLCNVSRNGFDNIFLSAYLGLSTVAIYNNYYLILTGVISVMGVVSQAVIASIGNSIATETVNKNYDDFEKFNFLYMFISGAITVILLLVYQPFMVLWVGADYLLPFSVVIALSLYFYILKMGDVRGMYNDAAGLWWEQRYRTVLEVVVNIYLNYILIFRYGVLGIVLASLISCFFIGFLGSSIVTFRSYFGYNKFYMYLKNQMLYMLCTLMLAGLICFGVNNSDQLAPVYEIVKRVIVGIVLYVCSMYLLWHQTKVFKSMQAFLTNSLAIIKRL